MAGMILRLRGRAADAQRYASSFMLNYLNATLEELDGEDWKRRLRLFPG